MAKSRPRISIYVLLFLCTLPCFLAYSQQEKRIKGKIVAQNEPLENVKIAIEDQVVGVSDSQGTYEIQAAVGDIVVYTYLGMKPVKILVEDVTEIINIRMEPEVEQLDEVIVSKRKVRDLKVEYPTNQNIVKTAFGYLDKATFSGNLKVLGKDKIQNASNLCILDVLRGEFAGVRVIGDCVSGGYVQVRSTPSLNNPAANNQAIRNPGAVYDVDGLILTDPPIWIPVDNIERVAVLIGFASTVRYGGIGSSGVVVINTRTGTTETAFKTSEPNLRYNPDVYGGDALPYTSVSQNNRPAYLKELYACKDLQTAKKQFKSFSLQYANSPFFFLDAFEYFMDEWEEKEFAQKIIDKNYALFEKNPVHLKAMAYLLEHHGFFKRAKEANREVLKLRPQYVQSFFDLANSNLNLNNPKRALEFYLRFNDLVKKQYFIIDSLELKSFYQREVKGAFALNPDYLFTVTSDDEDTSEDFSLGDTRLVFEWNDSEAEFELQFVGPNQGFSSWTHTTAQNSEDILNEKLLGYNVKDFIIDNTMRGEWKINLTYLGNKSLSPTYLKVRIYNNYSTPQQRQSLKVFKLTVKDVPKQLLSIAKSGIPAK